MNLPVKLPMGDTTDPVEESFHLTEIGITRSLCVEGLQRSTTVLQSEAGAFVRSEGDSGRDQFYQTWLKTREFSDSSASAGEIRVVDLFSGCGGLSLGFQEACRAFSLRARHVFASEFQPDAADVYRRNFRPDLISQDDISTIVNGVFGADLTYTESQLVERTGPVQVLCGGPPCQGHSDLNNYTRRSDPRNSLFFTMARAAEIFRPKCILIENVPGVQRDRTGSFSSTLDGLTALGYHLVVRTVDASHFGVPQSRKRTIVCAFSEARSTARFIAALDGLGGDVARPSLWAIKDLCDIHPSTVFDSPSVLSDESKRRVDWLFDNSSHELPDEHRPDCHKTKQHSYKSVYGRMYHDRTAPTITTGFLVMGQGRFIHPTRRRTISPHEGARLQTFPDYFDFGTRNRTTYAKMIGNAVPPLLAYYLGLAVLHAVEYNFEKLSLNGFPALIKRNRSE